jgi:hypothetical protein
MAFSFVKLFKISKSNSIDSQSFTSPRTQRRFAVKKTEAAVSARVRSYSALDCFLVMPGKLFPFHWTVLAPVWQTLIPDPTGDTLMIIAVLKSS